VGVTVVVRVVVSVAVVVKNCAHGRFLELKSVGAVAGVALGRGNSGDLHLRAATMSAGCTT
jgi:hypothetical protein